MVAFLSSGMARACLSWAGNTPDCRDRLHTWQMDGAMYVDSRFNSHVGIGSSGHDFVGALFITWIISDTVAGWKADKVGRRSTTSLQMAAPQSSRIAFTVVDGCLPEVREFRHRVDAVHRTAPARSSEHRQCVADGIVALVYVSVAWWRGNQRRTSEMARSDTFQLRRPSPSFAVVYLTVRVSSTTKT